MKKIAIIIFSLLIFLLLPTFGYCSEKPVNIKEELLEGRVEKILQEQTDGSQKLLITVTAGSLSGKNIEVLNKVQPAQKIRYDKGDEVTIYYKQDVKNATYEIKGFVRRFPLFWLFLFFVLIFLFFGGLRGLRSLISIGFTFLIILKLILPQIIAGWDPILTTILGAVIIVPVTYYISYGFNPKTTVAILGTFISLVFAGILARIFSEAGKLTGYVALEASWDIAKHGIINSKGLMLSGLMIGILGILEDVTINQSSIVWDLKKQKLGNEVTELYKKAMVLGRDKMVSMVNALVLVYTGIAMPVLVLFLNNSFAISQVLNYEVLTEEIGRTLIGSIGLILAVPITTFLASVINFEE